MENIPKKAQILIEGGVEYIRKSLRFSPEVMSEYYVGDDFVSIAYGVNFNERELSSLTQRAGINGFMPELVRELREDVIGVASAKYDGYEFGGNSDSGKIEEINFIFLIRKSQYSRIMGKIKFWSIAKSFDHLIRLDVKTVQYA